LGSLERVAMRFGRVMASARSRWAGFLGLEIDHALVESIIVGGELGALQPHQQLVLGDMIAIAHQDLRNDAAVIMLDRLDVAARLDDAGRHGGARQRRQRRPQHERPEPEHADAKAGPDIAMNRGWADAAGFIGSS
jgi:hypothetical protein